MTHCVSLRPIRAVELEETTSSRPRPVRPIPMPIPSWEWWVKVATRSRRPSIWAIYTSLRHTAFYTGFRCILQLYSTLSSSRPACHAIQHIQRIQRIQLYSYTAIHAIQHTALYSLPQPPGSHLRVRPGSACAHVSHLPQYVVTSAPTVRGASYE